MLRRTRISSTPNMTLLSAALSRPGIDPRIWCSLGYTVGESVVDPAYGDLVEVCLLPSGQQVTVRVPQTYAGASFGVGDGRIHQNDEVIVLFPDGDPATGGIIAARLWSSSDIPPQLVVDHPADHVEVREKDTSWRLKLQGSGQWVFEGEDEVFFKAAKKWTFEGSADLEFKTSEKQVYDCATFVAKTGNVRLGAESATEALVLGTTYRQKEALKHTQDSAALIQMTTASAQLIAAAAPMLAVPIVGPMLGAPMLALAGTALGLAASGLTSAITSFETSPYLSTVSKTT